MRNYLEEYRRDLLTCPKAGTGCHAWVGHMTTLAWQAGVPWDVAESEIRANMSRPPNPPGEIREALESARARMPDWKPKEEYLAALKAGKVVPVPLPPPPKKAVMLPGFVDELAVEVPDGIGSESWQEASPYRVTGGRDDAIYLIQQLYGDGEIIFIGPFRGKEVHPAIEWRKRFCNPDEPLPEFIAPNPVDGKEHPKKNGIGTSVRCDAAVSCFRFAVAEMDGVPLEVQARFWWKWKETPELGGNFPIAVLVYSGGKSLHAWIRVDAADAEAWREWVYKGLFPKVLIPLGCDPACKNAIRSSRLPGAFREDKGKRQRLLYLAPDARPPAKPLSSRVKDAAAYLAKRRPELAEADDPAAPEDAGADKGKKKIQIIDIANAFFMSLGDPLPVRFWRGTWYQWQAGHYCERDEKSIFGEVMAYLRRAWPGKATSATARGIMDHAIAADLCMVPQDFIKPCWLPDGESAAGLWAMRNCLVDIEAAARGEKATQPFTARLFGTLAVDYDFDPAAECPLWMKTLEEILPVEDDRLMLQLMFGLLLVPDTSWDVDFFLYGDGGTGKSVVAEVLAAMLGKGNVSNLSYSDLDEKHGQHVLSETLANITDEIPSRLNYLDLSSVEAQLKRVASGAEVKCERKNRDISFAPATARLVFCTNTLPIFSDLSEGLWRRLRVIPFNVKQSDKPTTDLNLSQKLKGELSGILNWAIAGLRRLRTEFDKGGFPKLGGGAEILQDHRRTCDTEREFLEEFYTVREKVMLSSSKVYGTYRTWCESNGYRPKGANRFAQDVRRVYPGVVAGRDWLDGKRQRVWFNLAVDDCNPPPGWVAVDSMDSTF